MYIQTYGLEDQDQEFISSLKNNINLIKITQMAKHFICEKN